MWPTLSDGDAVVCRVVRDDDRLRAGDLVVARHPFRNETILKRVAVVHDDGRLFVVGDHPDPTSSEDSHNFGPLRRDRVIAWRQGDKEGDKEPPVS